MSDVIQLRSLLKETIEQLHESKEQAEYYKELGKENEFSLLEKIKEKEAEIRYFFKDIPDITDVEFDSLMKKNLEISYLSRCYQLDHECKKKGHWNYSDCNYTIEGTECYPDYMKKIGQQQKDFYSMDSKKLARHSLQNKIKTLKNKILQVADKKEIDFKYDNYMLDQTTLKSKIQAIKSLIKDYYIDFYKPKDVKPERSKQSVSIIKPYSGMRLGVNASM